MLPEMNIRLASLSKALEEVILPALPADQKLAREQTGLILGHLRLIAAQWRYVPEFARASARNLIALQTRLLAIADGADADALRNAGAAVAENLDQLGVDALARETRKLGAEIERFCKTPCDDAVRAAELRAAVFAHTDVQARIEGTWFAAMRPDVDGNALNAEFVGRMNGCEA